MGLDKLKKKKKPHQLVSKRKDGKRPGYYGSDDFGHGEDGRGGGGGGGGGDSDDNYMDYYVSPAPSPAPAPAPSYDTADFAYTTPSPSPEPDTSGDDDYSIQDDLTDYATNVMETASVDGGFEDDGDDGESLYVSPTLKMKEEEPYYGYTPGPNTVTADELSNLNRGIGDVDELGSTFSKIQAVNPIENQGFFDSGIGKTLKYAGLTLTGAGAFGPTLGKGANLYSQYNKTKSALNYINQLTKGRTPTYAELINMPKGTGPKGPPTGFDDNDSGSNNIIPKNVIAKNVQRYSPAQINTLQKNRDLLQTYAEAGRLNEKGTQTLQQMNNIIEQYLV